MKQLQNNFTTPEQSKRLLELGVPRWTADCALLLNKYTNKYEYIVINSQDDYNFMDENTLPCWSVGRLIEIYLICVCSTLQLVELTDDDIPLIDEMVNKIEEGAAKYLDFSKLEV